MIKNFFLLFFVSLFILGCQQNEDIKTHGVNELLRKFYLFFKVILRITVNLVAVVPCIIIRLLSPWLVIRIERIPGDNYAQFANDPAVYYC